MQILDRTNCKRFIAYGKGKSTELNLELILFIHSFLVFTIPTLFVWSTGVWVGIMNMIIGSVGILIGLLVFWNDEFELLVFWTWSLCLLVFWNDEFELLVFWNDEFKGWYYELSLLVFWKGLIGILKGSVGILKRSVGILKGSVGILKGFIGILKSSVGILKGSVGILNILRKNKLLEPKEISRMPWHFPRYPLLLLTSANRYAGVKHYHQDRHCQRRWKSLSRCDGDLQQR